jgi:hypothetical protein
LALPCGKKKEPETKQKGQKNYIPAYFIFFATALKSQMLGLAGERGLARSTGTSGDWAGKYTLKKEWS